MATDAAHFVDEQLVVELAKGMCRLPSPQGAELPMALYVADQLEQLGFEVELQEVVKDRPNVVAIARGSPEYQSYLFNGHLDMPMPFGKWRQDPWQPWIEDGVLYGGGLQDMKGGVAALMTGAAAAMKAGSDRRGDIIVAIVMHHDTIGLGLKYFLESNAWQIDAGVCGEPTNLNLQLFHGGAWAWEMRTRGVPRHQSRLEEGVNAITGMMRILQQLDTSALTYTPDPRYPHLPRIVTGYIAGGDYASTTAEECVARGDIRYLPGMSIDGMKADLRRIIERVCAETPGLSGSVRTLAQQWPFSVSADEPAVAALAAAHTRITGHPPELAVGLPPGAFITDAADMVRHGISTALYGPGDWNTAPDEGIPIRDLITAARVYAAACADIVARPRRAPLAA